MIPKASRSARVGCAAAGLGRAPRGFRAAFSLLGAWSALACSPAVAPEAENPHEAHVQQLKEEIARLNDRVARAERERDEARLQVEPSDARSDETFADEDRPSESARSVPVSSETRPTLAVVKMGPQGVVPTETLWVDSPLGDDEEEPEPRLRPVLRVHGAEGDVAHVVEPRGEAAVQARAPGVDQSSKETVLSEAERKKMRAEAATVAEYEAAVAAVRAQSCAKGEAGLRRFLARHADHPYSDNALYWLGECAFQKGDYAAARDTFADVLARYPGENKVPDALYKLALSYERLGLVEEAQKTVGQLLAAHPNTAAARRVSETHSSK